MRHCPKCSLTFDDSAKICRSCGAILHDVADEVSAVVDPEEPLAPVEQAPDEINEEGSWICRNCRETVPGTFEVCWNCGGEQLESSRTGSARESIDASAMDDQNPDLVRSMEPIHAARCVACGSSKIVPRATIVDQGQHSSGSLCVVVFGEPDAILFKDRLFGTLTADICGDCGHANIRVQNAGELYEHYLRSRQ